MKIRDICIINKNQWAVLKASVECKNETKDLFYAVPTSFSDMLCDTYADAFLIGLLPVAAMANEDIELCDCAVTKPLVKNIEKLLAPALTQMGCGNRTVKIVANCVDPVQKKRMTATGISLGVDSFYTILKCVNDIQAVLTINRCWNIEELDKSVTDFDFNFYQKKSVADALNLKIVPIVTNIHALHWEYFHLAYEKVHTFCNVSSAMALMNSINRYFYSSAGYSNSTVKLDFSDSSHYDSLIDSTISTDSFTMVSYGGEVGRIEKTHFIKENRIVQKNLDVCLTPVLDSNGVKKNCSFCDKCIRTMTTLDVLGCIANFSGVFDVDYYMHHKGKYWGHIIYAKLIRKDDFSREILNTAKNEKFGVPISAWFYFFKEGICNQFHKFRKKDRLK